MKTWRSLDENCPTCHGNGEVLDTVVHSGEYWTTSHQCYCVEVHHDVEMKKFLAELRNAE